MKSTIRGFLCITGNFCLAAMVASFVSAYVQGWFTVFYYVLAFAALSLNLYCGLVVPLRLGHELDDRRRSIQLSQKQQTVDDRR